MADLFKFGAYTIRQATEEDRELLAGWIARDPEHSRKGIAAEFFIHEEPGVGCYLLSDEAGPLYFFRTENTVRLHTQFGPSAEPEERERNRGALVEGMDWLAAMCAAKGASEIVFESVNPLLGRLAVQSMGCRRSSHELVRDLTMERAGLAQPKAWQPVPEPTTGETPSLLESLIGGLD